MTGVIIAIGVIAFIAWQILFYSRKKRLRRVSDAPFPEAWRILLREHVLFYARLTPEEKSRFERNTLLFLDEVKITGASTEVNDKDRVLIAAAAVIPLFYLGETGYFNLDEVVLYPDNFDGNYKVEGHARSIMGMVGNEHLSRSMILSRKALYQGFNNARDGQNTAIHEFVHLIDGWDGNIDGMPSAIMETPAILPWVELIRKKTQAILDRDSDIELYGATNQAEFLAVVSEYFFENPDRMREKHPEIYKALKEAFLKR